MNIASYIDHTLLKANATTNDIELLCEEALQFGFFAVCVNPCWIKFCSSILQKSDVKIASVIGFPLGANTTATKIYEVENCIANGVDEIDMVINIGWFKNKNYVAVGNEIETIKKRIGQKVLKVIIETCYLNDEEIAIASKIIEENGGDFVKTSTGFGTRGASTNDIQIIKKNINTINIKASGGIKNLATAKSYIALGVSRIGTSSGVQIINETEI